MTYWKERLQAARELRNAADHLVILAEDGCDVKGDAADGARLEQAFHNQRAAVQALLKGLDP